MKRKKTVAIRPEYTRATFEVLHAIRDMTPGEVASKCYVSASTIYKWRRGWQNGGTKYPQHHTLLAVARVAGLTFKLVPHDGKEEKLPRVVDGVQVFQ